ncbi:hypothetical protein [Treponema parvum]|nr:hypothetical protein [Treponema parvum]QTQ16591.1 hypothetical protein HXT04_07755 [Treponema parvum]
MTKNNMRKDPAQDRKDAVSPRILELRKKISDNEYVDGAIQRIAQVMSNRLVDNYMHRTLHG